MQKTVEVKSNEDGKKLNFNYTRAYNINFSLYSFTATENGLQIVEQILKFFQPVIRFLLEL